MTRKLSQKGEIVRKYLKLFPKTSKKSLAEKIYKENELLFRNSEHARSVIRCHTGTNGKRQRREIKDIIPHETNFSRDNPYGLPPSEATERSHYVLPKANNNILFLSDIHLPYHDIKALTTALEYGKQQNVNTIFLNGDIMDCYQASDHEKNPKNRDMAYELEICRNFLDLLKKEFPLAKIFYKEGNHETRWERFLRNKAAIVIGIEEFQLKILLKLGEKGIEWIPNGQLTVAGKLNIIHGNEYRGGGGINVARTLWLRAGDNVIAGDKHKTQSGLKTEITGSVKGAWSVGCLSELSPDWLRFNEWNHGFAHITIEPSGDFSVHNKQIINGKIM